MGIDDFKEEWHHQYIKQKRNLGFFHGYSPLHLALQNSADVAVVQALLSACPDVAKRACSNKEDDGEEEDGNHTDSQLPLRLALSEMSAQEVVILLLKAYPEAVSAADEVREHWFSLVLVLGRGCWLYACVFS